MSSSPQFPNIAPTQEQLRLNALDAYELLDTSAEPELDELTELASDLCGTPISLITLVSNERQWFKSRLGFHLPETPRFMSFCTHAIKGNSVFEVSDAQQDSRFKQNPLVVGNPNIRFYAGAPLMTSQGYALGTLCVIDTEPRVLSEEQRNGLKILARQVMLHFELKRSRIEREVEKKELVQVDNQLRDLQELVVQQFSSPAKTIGQATAAEEAKYQDRISLSGSMTALKERARTLENLVKQHLALNLIQ